MKNILKKEEKGTLLIARKKEPFKSQKV